MNITQTDIETALSKYTDPYLKTDLISAKVIKKMLIEQQRVQLDVVLGFPVQNYQLALTAALTDCLHALSPDIQLEINLSWKVEAHIVPSGARAIGGVKNIIAVASGKGGVGKSTTAVNLALALVAEGAKVGILDADIYGPSQPMMLGALTNPETKDQKTLEPVERYGVQSMSIGYLIEMDTPMVWRGPMVSSALQQLINDTNWRELDYLIVDLPPGTGDIQLTLSQKIPVSGAVIVTTPQDIALLDARKALGMFNKVRIPVLGIIENMSTHICSQCGHEEAIFGAGGGEQMAEQYNIELLGSLPLDRRIREQADSGKPTVVAEPESNISHVYRNIARKVAAQLSLQAKNFSAKFPKIVIE